MSDRESYRYAIIGGSSGYKFIKPNLVKKLGKIKTPYGMSSPCFILENKGLKFYYLSRHGEKGYDIAASFVNYRANIYALKKAGVKNLITWSGPGALNKKYKIGEIVIAEDIADFTKNRKYTFYEKNGIGFIRTNPLNCPYMETKVKRIKRNIKKGIYVCTEGPRLETKAEIKMFIKNGFDFVGMTLSPEIFLAKELEMHILCLCYITNYAEGVENKKRKNDVLFGGLLEEKQIKLLDASIEKLFDLAVKVLKSIKEDKQKCFCSRTMNRYRKLNKKLLFD